MKLLKSRKKLLKSKPKTSAKPAISEVDLDACAEYFNLEHYRKATGNLEFDETTGLEHYLNTGWRDDLDPSVEFLTRGYLALYPDIAEAGINPLLHYVMHGRFENRHIQRADAGFKGKLEEISHSGIRGWAANELNSALIMPLKVFINDQLYATIHNDKARPDLQRHGITDGAGGFALGIPFGRLEPGTYNVAVVFPDAKRLEESLVVGSTALETNRIAPVALTDARMDKLKVVVPIFNAVEDVRVCIARLRKHTPEKVEVILINDCSTDPAVQAELEKLADEKRFRVLENETNLGFTKTVNRGLTEAGDSDVVILNSDARVTPRWIEGLEAAAQSRPRVATVTAMSDRAGAFSAPNIGNDNQLPPGVKEEDFAIAFRRRSLRLYPEVPTGNGFCMLIRREALDALGGLDEEAFPRGYGEENDFCMRALRAGWANVIDDATYVFHDRSKSFGEEKNDNMVKGRAVIDERYPEYKLMTKVYQTGSALLMARFRSRLALADCTNGRGVLPRALFVLATRTGGTPQTNADLMGALSDAYECYVLVCDSRTLELSVYERGTSRVLSTYSLDEPIEPLTHTSSEYDALVSAWMGALDLSIVHIRHLGWHSLNLPALARRTGAKVVMSFHDYYVLSPSLKLLDDENVFCGETYTQAGAQRPIEIWPGGSLPALTDDWIGYWRQRMSEALNHCDSFVTTSQSARNLIADAFPNIPDEHFHVIPHGRDFAKFENLQNLPDGTGPVRILVPGNIDKAKGLEVICKLTELDQLGMFEFHILGRVETSSLTAEQAERLHTHGRYNRDDFANKVREIAPHFGVVFSIWDETYCHTLTEMWSVGLPVAVLDFPNVRNRVEKSGAGWILESLEPDQILAELQHLASSREELISKGSRAIEWQFERGRAQSCRQMASRYLDVYSHLPVDTPKPKIAVTCPASSDLRKANASTQIRLWERTVNSTQRPHTFLRSDAQSLIAQMNLGMIDGAIVQRTAIPSSLVDEFLETVEATGTRYIFEIDDDLLGVPSDKDANGFYAAYAPKLEKLISSAEGLIVSTEALAQRFSGLSDNIIQIENRISERLWAGGKSPASSKRQRLIYAGSRTHEEDLSFALEALSIARNTIPGIELSAIGVTARTDLPSWVDVISVPSDCKSYSEFVPWLREEVKDAVLGIAPLLATDFNRYKSDLKVLDYAALGLPVLASDVESFRPLAGLKPSQGVSLVSNDPAAWAKALVTLLSKPDELVNAGRALQSWVFANRALSDDLGRFDAFVGSNLPKKTATVTKNGTAISVVSAAEMRKQELKRYPITRERSYPSVRPHFANLEDVEPRWREIMEEKFSRTKGEVPHGEVIRISDATVFGNGVVKDKLGRLIKETLPSNQIETDDREAVEHIDGLTVLLRKHGDSNFGHWLLELCTRVRDFQRAFPNEDLRIAAPKTPVELRELRETTLSWLGISPDRIVWIDGSPRTFEDVAFVTTNSIHSHTHDASAILEFRDAALKAVAPDFNEPRSRLYVARKPSLRRRLVNEEEIITICEANGFIVIYPEDLTITEQARTFANAEMVVGISGAALTNIIFAPKDCKILSLNPNHGHEFFFWDLGTIIGQEFSFLFGQSAQVDQLGHADFSINPADLIAWFEALS